jgi:hypothetical protein
MTVSDGEKHVPSKALVCMWVTSLICYPSSYHNLLENVAHYAIDWSHVATNCFAFVLPMLRFLGQKGQNTIPYVNLFSLFPTTSFSGMIRISVFDMLQIPCGCSKICSWCNAANCTSVARAGLYLCTCKGDGLLGTQYVKRAEHDPHLHLIA